MTNYSAPPTQPPPPGDPPPPGYASGDLPPAKRTNGWAIASLICGILGCVPWLAGVLAVIFGIIGIRKANDPQVNGGKGLAIAGLILGIISIILWSLFGAGLFALLSGTQQQRDLARQFINDLAAGNVTAAQAKTTANITPQQVQSAADEFQAWGAVRDITLIGVEVDAATGTKVGGAVTFLDRAVSFEATVVKEGETYKIDDFRYQAR